MVSEAAFGRLFPPQKRGGSTPDIHPQIFNNDKEKKPQDRIEKRASAQESHDRGS